MNKLPQDAEEFIGEHSFYRLLTAENEAPRHGFVVAVDDLRAWMTGHVRVPVDATQTMLDAAGDITSRHDDYARAVWRAMLNASKGE